MRRKQTASLDIKKVNRSNIYKILLSAKGLSRQEVLQKLQLSLPTVTQNIEELQKEGLIHECGEIGNTGGRPAKIYTAVLDARTAIGLDITKNHITCVAVDLSGTVVESIRISEKFSRSEAYFEKLGNTVQQIIEKAQLNTKQILGVGIGVPGLVTDDNQSVFYGEILKFTGTTCAEFGKHIPFPVTLHNDANAAGFAETWSRKEQTNAFYLMLSNNIGGSVLINSQVYSGDNLRSGEIGHVALVPDGKQCYCGQRGCVDSYCSATVLSDYTDGNLHTFFQLLDKKDSRIIKIWNQYLVYLARTVTTLNFLFDSPIILGGYVGEYIDPYLDDLKERAAKLHPFCKESDYLQACQYKKQAIAAGAALSYIDSFILSI